MNKRPFLLGLGTGLIVGAMLLQLMIVGQQQKDRLVNRGQDEQTEAADSPSYTQAELDQRIAEERERVTKELQEAQKKQEPACGKPAEEVPSASKPETNQSKTSANNNAASGKTGAASNQTDQKAEPAAKRIIVRIEPGSSVTEVADLLVAPAPC